MPLEYICQTCGKVFTDKPHRNRKHCSLTCYNISKRGKQVTPRIPLKERLLSKVHVGGPGDCWEWFGSGDRYGHIGRGGQDGGMMGAHCASYEVFNGPIPDGMFVLHRCDNTRCCNPAHLFLGTSRDNIDDMLAKQRSLVGTRNHAAKLTETDVIAIRASSEQSIVLAARYGVSGATISSIRLRKTWKHI